MKKAVLFDLDGTLWDSVDQLTPAWNRILAAYGVSVTAPQLRALMGKTAEEFAAALLPEETPERGLAAVNACCREELTDLGITGGTLYPGLRPALEALGEKYALYIISNCQEGYIENFLEVHGFRDCFTGFLDHSTGLSKGANSRLLMEREGVDKAVYVGDTQGDETAAREGGVPFIHAAYGFGRAEAPAETVDSPAGLPPAVDRLLGG